MNVLVVQVGLIKHLMIRFHKSSKLSNFHNIILSGYMYMYHGHSLSFKSVHRSTFFI